MKLSLKLDTWPEYAIEGKQAIAEHDGILLYLIISYVHYSPKNRVQ